MVVCHAVQEAGMPDHEYMLCLVWCGQSVVKMYQLVKSGILMEHTLVLKMF